MDQVEALISKCCMLECWESDGDGGVELRRAVVGHDDHATQGEGHCKGREYYVVWVVLRRASWGSYHMGNFRQHCQVHCEVDEGAYDLNEVHLQVFDKDAILVTDEWVEALHAVGCDCGHAALVDSPLAIFDLTDCQESESDSEQASNDLASEKSQGLRQVVNKLALIEVYSDRCSRIKVSFGDSSKYK